MLFFLCTEIIREVKINGDNVTELLRVTADQLEPDCLNRALLTAVENNNHFNVGKLILNGADNIEECLKRSKEDKKPHARAMLLLVKAAQEGNQDLILKVFGEYTPGLDAHELLDESFLDVQRAVVSGEVINKPREHIFGLTHYDKLAQDEDFHSLQQVFTVVPVEIARRNGHAAVREELLLNTDVNQEEGIVHWHGLRLRVLDVSWLRKIHWVKRLRLGRNGFRQLPNEMGTYLKQV